MAGLLTCESSSLQQKAEMLRCAANRQIFAFASYKCNCQASRKSSLYMQKKKIVLVGAVIQRLSEVKRQKVRLGKT